MADALWFRERGYTCLSAFKRYAMSGTRCLAAYLFEGFAERYPHLPVRILLPPLQLHLRRRRTICSKTRDCLRRSLASSVVLHEVAATALTRTGRARRPRQRRGRCDCCTGFERARIL